MALFVPMEKVRVIEDADANLVVFEGLTQVLDIHISIPRNGHGFNSASDFLPQTVCDFGLPKDTPYGHN